MLGYTNKISLVAGLLAVTELAFAQVSGPYQFGAGCSLTLRGVQNNDQVAIVPATSILTGATVRLTFNAIFSDSEFQIDTFVIMF
jgi:hypothetical protein